MSYSNTSVDITAEKNAQLIFQGSQSGAAIVVGDFEEGKTIHWNMGCHFGGIHIWTEEIKQFFINIVIYARGDSKLYQLP